MMAGYEKQNEGSELRARHTRPASRLIPRGATAVLKDTFARKIIVEEVAEGKMEME